MELRSRSGKVGSPGSADNGVESKKTTPKKDSPPATPEAATPAAPAKSKLSTFITRTIVGLIMIFAFLLILSAGHAFVCVFIVLLQIFTFREMINIRYREAKERKLWGFRSLHWYALVSRRRWLLFFVPRLRPAQQQFLLLWG